jgi:hypothetical protein
VSSFQSLPQPGWSGPTQLLRLRREIERNRRRLPEIDHPETARVFQQLIRDAEEQLERIGARSI